ncbi:hypothetical protein C900_05821 [Fulvivirga imtechensis AK7]|uniref:Uncharacterized protein n=1 Tax=Fulvivirga imtechensis AK7 TaxID=1237149 RepID=L8JKS4_9BACT|nr:hypothetical protein [Fulvivirga imtechensis]ELR68808.1 hypothetical protein C900_05821 [Fulvivirga imtechensis AK7]
MRAVLLIFSTCLLFFLSVWLLRDNIRRWILPNRVIVQAQGNVDAEQVKIYWTAETADDTLTIFSGARQTDAIFEAGGFNIFLLYYQNQQVAQFEQFKQSVTAPHTYTFHLWQEGDSIYTNLKIYGPDANL